MNCKVYLGSERVKLLLRLSPSGGAESVVPLYVYHRLLTLVCFIYLSVYLFIYFSCSIFRCVTVNIPDSHFVSQALDAGLFIWLFIFHVPYFYVPLLIFLTFISYHWLLTLVRFYLFICLFIFRLPCFDVLPLIFLTLILYHRLLTLLQFYLFVCLFIFYGPYFDVSSLIFLTLTSYHRLLTLVCLIHFVLFVY